MYLFSNWLGCDKFLNLKEKKGGNYCLHRVGAKEGGNRLTVIEKFWCVEGTGHEYFFLLGQNCGGVER